MRPFSNLFLKLRVKHDNILVLIQKLVTEAKKLFIDDEELFYYVDVVRKETPSHQ